MNECPTRVRTGSPPRSVMISGTAREVIRLWMTVAPGSPASSRLAISAVSTEGDTSSPRSSTTKQRSASPSKARPRSAPVSVTFRCRSRRFSGSIGLASWFGNVPSSSKYIGTSAMGRPSNTGGTVCPAMPLPASTATFSGRMPDTSTSFFRCSAYPLSRSRDTMRPAGAGPARPAGPHHLFQVGQPGFLAHRLGPGPAQLDAVVAGRVVAGGDHGAGYAEDAAGVVEHVGGAETGRDALGALRRRAAAERLGQRGGGGPHVVHGHQLARAGQPDEPGPHRLGYPLVQVIGYDTTDVVRLEDFRQLTHLLSPVRPRRRRPASEPTGWNRD